MAETVLPVLPSVFAVDECAVESVTLATEAVAALWAARGGRDGARVTVDRRHAALAFRSERLVRWPEAPAELWDPVAGDYPTADGWIRLHTNFAHHRRAALAALGVAVAERDAVAAAVAGWRAEELETAVVGAGGCAAALRSVDEWRAHPQGAAVRALPLIEATALGAGGPPLPPLAVADRPLSGLRVLDLTRVIAGPVCGRVLAAYGADVLRVDARPPDDMAALVPDTTVGKRACALDLRSPEDRSAFEALVGSAHVVVQGYRPGALAALGYSAEELAARRPGLVVGTLSAYGRVGPWAGRRGFDSLVQLSSGIADEGRRLTGSARPVPLPAQALDHGTGYLLAAGVVRALGRRATGEAPGAHVEVSLARTAWWLEGMGRRDPSGGVDPGPDAAADLLVTVDSAFGPVTLVRCPGAIEGAPPRWDHPPRPLGSDPPAW